MYFLQCLLHCDHEQGQSGTRLAIPVLWTFGAENHQRPQNVFGKCFINSTVSQHSNIKLKIIVCSTSSLEVPRITLPEFIWHQFQPSYILALVLKYSYNSIVKFNYSELQFNSIIILKCRVTMRLDCSLVGGLRHKLFLSWKL